mmetsp:Transcript_24725/g.40936  ORF Transcript_24725/g.40936 Transcript_24725/m.40936 type:complete len:213 (-) Transcript_24725:677-1315(-)|eukprot:CAMPEP_0119007110 /NCGR_PEP_ID=MMETSP1176-20130426/2776_1 /TAXON_ID=265551 /ORGANISM="Synedropsis recta cf, Strain CCMP1620" /LENGTH=212 /DNA_ID=CAMNT_0006959185 /DNA_START=118 /DNA_END=756 /DNA_ORIENTATION=+
MSTEIATPAAVTEPISEVSVDDKIMSDLASVKEKMDLCDNMLHPGDGSPAPSLKNNEALLGVIGFLEACGPRMVELVEAATQGALSEAVLMECLTINDRLLKLLADIDTYAFTETAATTTAAAAPVKSAEQAFGDLLLDDSTDEKTPAPASAGSKTTGEEDPFGDDLLSAGEDGKMPASGEDSKTPSSEDAKASAQPKDDFDDFLAGRTTGS